jgi:hypothetical protein
MNQVGETPIMYAYMWRDCKPQYIGNHIVLHAAQHAYQRGLHMNFNMGEEYVASTCRMVIQTTPKTHQFPPLPLHVRG